MYEIAQIYVILSLKIGLLTHHLPLLYYLLARHTQLKEGLDTLQHIPDAHVFLSPVIVIFISIRFNMSLGMLEQLRHIAI